jgi:hypothetical protein
VRGIPLMTDPSLEVNAFAGCEAGTPFMAATEGFLLASDAIGQTRATDELFGTRTYDSYTNTVLPNLVRDEKGASPALPPGTIPPQYLLDPRRASRAREIFDDMVALVTNLGITILATPVVPMVNPAACLVTCNVLAHASFRRGVNSMKVRPTAPGHKTHSMQVTCGGHSSAGPSAVGRTCLTSLLGLSVQLAGTCSTRSTCCAVTRSQARDRSGCNRWSTIGTGATRTCGLDSKV